MTPQQDTAPRPKETFHAYEKRMGHRAKLPKGRGPIPDDYRKRPTVKELILDALSDGEEKTSLQICAIIDRSKGHTSGELSELARAGKIKKQMRNVGSVKNAHWRLA